MSSIPSVLLVDDVCKWMELGSCIIKKNSSQLFLFLPVNIAESADVLQRSKIDKCLFCLSTYVHRLWVWMILSVKCDSCQWSWRSVSWCHARSPFGVGKHQFQTLNHRNLSLMLWPLKHLVPPSFLSSAIWTAVWFLEASSLPVGTLLNQFLRLQN